MTSSKQHPTPTHIIVGIEKATPSQADAFATLMTFVTPIVSEDQVKSFVAYTGAAGIDPSQVKLFSILKEKHMTGADL